MIRKALAAAVCLGSLVVASYAVGTPLSASSAAPTTLRLSVTDCVCFAPEIVAIQKGWMQTLLTKYNVTLKSSYFDSGPPQIAALVSNSLDIATVGASPTVGMISQDAPVDFFYVSDQGLGIEGLVVKSNSGIESVKDLVGKKVGVPFGTSGEFMLKAALQVAGVNASSVPMVNLQASAIAAAWQRNDIQAAWVWYPWLAKLKQLDGRVIMLDSDVVNATKGRQNATWDIYAVRRDFAQRYPQFLRDFVAVIDRATTYTNANKRAVADTMYSKIGAPSADSAYEQLLGDQFLTVRDNASPEWLGSPSHPGAFVDIVENVAKFLHSSGAVRTLPSTKQIENHLTSSFLTTK